MIERFYDVMLSMTVNDVIFMIGKIHWKVSSPNYTFFYKNNL